MKYHKEFCIYAKLLNQIHIFKTSSKIIVLHCVTRIVCPYFSIMDLNTHSDAPIPATQSAHKVFTRLNLAVRYHMTPCQPTNWINNRSWKLALIHYPQIMITTKCSTHCLSMKSNWKRLFVIFAPLCPEKTNIESRATARAKLQQVGGMSPSWFTCQQNKRQPCDTTRRVTQH